MLNGSESYPASYVALVVWYLTQKHQFWFLKLSGIARCY